MVVVTVIDLDGGGWTNTGVVCLMVTTLLLSLFFPGSVLDYCVLYLHSSGTVYTSLL